MMQSPKSANTTVMPDHSMLVSVEALTKFGNGSDAQGRRDLRALLASERDSPTFSGPTERPKSVRMAAPKDEDAILALLIADLSENAAHIAPIDEEKVLETIRMGTRGRGGFTGVIDDAEGKPIAVVILIPYQWWWSQGWYFQEIVNFVDPEHRRSRHAEDLLDFSRWCSDHMSKLMGYRWWLLCGVLGAWRVAAKIALYRRKFQQAGAAFVYPAPSIRGN